VVGGSILPYRTVSKVWKGIAVPLSLGQLKEREQEAVKVYKALGHPARLRIIDLLLKQEEVGCAELARACNLSAPALSHHMRILQECRLVDVRAEGPYHYFRVERERLGRFAPALLSP
jgi:ArsR family transcriptional regulator